MMSDRVMHAGEATTNGDNPAPQVRGLRIASDELDAQHDEGDFDFLFNLDEMAHYMIILGYVHYARRRPNILDVGCGQGRLFELLKNFHFKRYLGLDLSAVAVDKARSLARKNARFEVANFEEWQAPQRFDVIIFNESLYYADHPAAILTRYSGWLARGGSLIVSMWRCPQHVAIWQDLSRGFKAIDAHAVQNRRGQIWDIRLLRPLATHEQLIRQSVKSPFVRRFLERLPHNKSKQRGPAAMENVL